MTTVQIPEQPERFISSLDLQFSKKRRFYSMAEPRREMTGDVFHHEDAPAIGTQ